MNTGSKMFGAAGVDLLDISAGIYETMNTAWGPAGFEQGWKAGLAEEIKKTASVPVVCTALVREPPFAEQLLRDKVCDFTGSARAHLADPVWSPMLLLSLPELHRCIWRKFREFTVNMCIPPAMS